jgi:hypothetical protein
VEEGLAPEGREAEAVPAQAPEEMPAGTASVPPPAAPDPGLALLLLGLTLLAGNAGEEDESTTRRG